MRCWMNGAPLTECHTFTFPQNLSSSHSSLLPNRFLLLLCVAGNGAITIHPASIARHPPSCQFDFVVREVCSCFREYLDNLQMPMLSSQVQWRVIGVVSQMD